MYRSNYNHGIGHFYDQLPDGARRRTSASPSSHERGNNLIEA